MSSTSQRLKQRTRGAHDHLEDGLRLLDDPITRARLLAVLERFHGFWAATEPVIDTWAAENPITAARIQWPRRRRITAIAADLAALGGSADALPVAPPVFSRTDTAQVLGWLYVAEGSTLGGAVIGRRLERRSAPPGSRLRTFVPYPEGPGPMWGEYVRFVDTWSARDRHRPDEVADAAVEVFDALAGWLEPVMLERAA